ncbi:VOC family protein [Mucilaginibacter lappiensis]|uniref:Catechol-2,3-dioxygenase n=1 Tax=Mucilaginibacter lappiensis TaxID=354630 RepID=A0A841JR71_9SPHI|nr:VOC family protein [Mucilaginibacter lappiensis]MBB6131268.1 catechol-2,3-dioxygenase [Mucilaginibacter lappiensis]
MKIKEIHLLTNNLPATEQFYNHVLDIKTNQKTDQEVSFRIGKTEVIFINSTESVNPNYHLAFDIPTNKLEEAFARIKEKVAILPVTTDNYLSDIKLWNARSFYFYDNNGNLLELICRYDLQNQSEAPFSGNSILHVSEIGIVAENVQVCADDLIARYGLDYYAKQPKQDNFMALGDEAGLFILVDPNRNWFPTDKKAEAFWTKIIFHSESGNHVLDINHA